MNRTCDECGKEMPAELAMDRVRVGNQYLCKECGDKYVRGIFGSGFSSVTGNFKSIDNISDLEDSSNKTIVLR